MRLPQGHGGAEQGACSLFDATPGSDVVHVHGTATRTGAPLAHQPGIVPLPGAEIDA